MYVIENGSKYAVNIDNAERIQTVFDVETKEYCIDLQKYDGNYICTLGKYDDKEAAEYAFQQIIIAIVRGDKVFFVLSDEEIENARRS